MSSRSRWLRPFRVAASRVGLVRDPTRAPARAMERWLDAHAADAVHRARVPGLAVAVRFADGRSVRRTYGTAGTVGPVTDATTFQALSISKPVTAMLVLALADDGLLELDAPILRRLRGWRLPPERTGGFDPDGITLRRLLSHSAGLNVNGYGWTEISARLPAARLLASTFDDARTIRLVEPPGTRLRYSGGGYAIVELAVEEATGRRFADVARARLLAPSGITASDYEPTAAHAATLATPHDATGRPRPTLDLASVAASGLIGTVADLATLYATLAPGPDGAPAGRGVLSPASCAAILTPTAVDDAGAIIGLGPYLKERHGDLKYMHRGHDPGGYVHVEGLARRGVVLALAANATTGADLVPAMAHALRTIAYDLVV
jgi:CubicO group peptidase (beta-lactamase class C family)